MGQASRQALDRLAELAAIVNLIDDQQNFVGMVGLVERFATSRVASIDTGFCPSTFFAGSPLYIEDAAESLFADHPARIELGFNAYAGFPLLVAVATPAHRTADGARTADLRPLPPSRA